MRKSTLVVFTAVTSLFLVSSLRAQVAADKFTYGRFEFFSPSHLRVDSTAAVRVLRIVAKAVSAVRGLPADAAPVKPIRVSVATHPQADADAVSFPQHRIIVLPARRWLDWSPEKLERTVQHEVGHIVLAHYLGLAPIARWLDEGFAEWTAGALSCEYETMVRIDIVGRGTSNPRRVASSVTSIHSSPLETAYLATFLHFLDTDGLVSTGRLLDAVRKSGAEAALSELFGASLGALESRWWSSGMESYRGEVHGGSGKLCH